MDWELYIKHVICGFLPLTAVLAVYFIILFAAKKKQTIAHILVSFVFCFYLIGILTMTGIWWFRSFSPNFNWIPFVDMIRGSGRYCAECSTICSFGIVSADSL